MKNLTILFSFGILALLTFSLDNQFETYANEESMNENTMMNDHNASENIMMHHDTMMGMDRVTTPLKQVKNGVLPHNVKCSEGYELIFKAYDNSPACVRPSIASILVMRGWAIGKDSMMKTTGQNMTGLQGMVNRTMAIETMKEGDGMTMNNIENKSITKTMSQNSIKKPTASNQMYQSGMEESQYKDAPALVGISDYINTTPANLAQDMKGKVVVYDFWTFNCINCIHTLPHVVDLSNKYLGKNVLVIGIHSPETIFEQDPNNVLDAIHRYNIQYPVVTDNGFQTWNAFGNHYWPHIYIADAQGKIRYDHIGEGSYDEIDNMVASLLLEQENQKPKELGMG